MCICSNFLSHYPDFMKVYNGNCTNYDPYSIGNYTILQEYIKCVLSLLTEVVGPTNILLIKFMVRSTTFVRGGSTHLIYSRSII